MFVYWLILKNVTKVADEEMGGVMYERNLTGSMTFPRAQVFGDLQVLTYFLNPVFWGSGETWLCF